MAISAVSSTSAAAPRSPGNASNSNSVREAELEKQIAAKISLARCTDCDETAEKANKDAEDLRAQLAALKAKDTQGASAAPTTSNLPAAAVGVETNPEPSEPADPYRRDITRSNAEGDYRPIAVRASPAVQAALSDLNSADNA